MPDGEMIIVAVSGPDRGYVWLRLPSIYVVEEAANDWEFFPPRYA